MASLNPLELGGASLSLIGNIGSSILDIKAAGAQKQQAIGQFVSDMFNIELQSMQFSQEEAQRTGDVSAAIARQQALFAAAGRDISQGAAASIARAEAGKSARIGISRTRLAEMKKRADTASAIARYRSAKKAAKYGKIASILGLVGAVGSFGTTLGGLK